jgi:hypothetical protein
MSEFLVEVRPGRERIYRSTWALREAMRNGEISADSRIFHRATSQWISITQHPEYRRFLTDGDPAWAQAAEPEGAGPADQPATAVPSRWAGFSRQLVQWRGRIAAAWAGWKRRLAAPASPPPSAPPASRPPMTRSKPPGQTPAPPTTGEVPHPPDSTRPRDRWTYFP